MAAKTDDQIRAQIMRLQREGFVKDERIRVGIRWAINSLRWVLGDAPAPARLADDRKHPAPR